MSMFRRMMKKEIDVPGGRDWKILTCVLFGTGLLISGTLSSSAQSRTTKIDPTLNGEMVWTVFAADHVFCEGGIARLQQQENMRAAMTVAKGHSTRAVNVDRLIGVDYRRKTNSQLVAAYAASLEDRTSDKWDKKTTLSVALECELVRRGLA